MTYANAGFLSTLQTRYIGPGRYATIFGGGFEGPEVAAMGPGTPGYSPTAPGSVNDNSVSKRFYLTWSGSYDIPVQDKSLQLFAVVENLLDKDPPVAPGGNGFPTNPAYFDTLGRSFRVGVRYSY
jgi:outer membrane receptor protein involved in Fe transport